MRRPLPDGRGSIRNFVALLGLLTWLALAQPAEARTIVVTDEDCERIAAISPDAPKLGWATAELQPGVYSGKSVVQLRAGRAFLIAMPLDKIPEGQRITKAELTIPVNYCEGEQRLSVRRILGDWGAGVNYKHRMVRPQPVEWSRPGAAGVASDSAAKATAQVKIIKRGEVNINVTEDVDLWYTGAAVNQGWIFRVEDQYGDMQLLFPISTYPNGFGSWKLHITYEPE